MKEKINIRTLSRKDLEAFFADNNEKPYRAKQVYEWLWKKSVQSFSDMTNISQNLKELLYQNYFINKTEISSVQKSNDGTIKVSFILHDGNFVEGVLIPEKERVTACISSQVGCPLNCAFCATGKYGFKRDLAFDEIFDEYVLLNNLAISNLKFPISNIVYMGMGEPLLNYDNVFKSIYKLTSDDALGISPRRITLSTVGIPAKIKQLADDIVRNSKFNIQHSTFRINLAISLHSANNDKRSEIVPVNKKYNLTELSESIKYFCNKTHSRITYEYLLLKDINDSLQDAKEFAQFCKISPCKINLIEYNNSEIERLKNLKSGLRIFQSSNLQSVKAFVEYLTSKNLVVQIRRSRGKDIHAACGQLANTPIEK